MYEIEYCNSLSKIEPIPTEKSVGESFANEYNRKLDSLDRYRLLIDMGRIVHCCAQDLCSCGSNMEFWERNKYLFNFLNAVYCYKEYVRSYSSSVTAINEKYFKEKGWYWIICTFRDYVVHQTIIIRDFKPKTGESLILWERVNKELKESSYSSPKHKKKAEKFCEVLEKHNSVLVTINGEQYLSINRLVEQFKEEFSEIMEKVNLNAFGEETKPCLKWLVEKMYKKNSQYLYTFYVDKAKGEVFEPNHSFEDYIRTMLQQITKESDVYRELCRFVEDEGYLLFYDENCSFHNLVHKFIR